MKYWNDVIFVCMQGVRETVAQCTTSVHEQRTLQYNAADGQKAHY